MNRSYARQVHKWGTLLALVVSLAAWPSLPAGGAAGVDAGEAGAFAYHVVATADTTVYLKWRMECPPTDHCAAHAYLEDTDGNWWRYLANRNEANVSVHVRTLAGSLAVPIIEEDHVPNGIGVIVDWPVARVGDFYFFVVSTHAGRIEEERVTNAVRVGISISDDVHMYKVSELPGVASARAGMPGLGAVSIIEWQAKQGAFGFAMPTVSPGYLRFGAAGTFLCDPFYAFPPLYDTLRCYDDFWGGPGQYTMVFPATVGPLDEYMTGWADIVIP